MIHRRAFAAAALLAAAALWAVAARAGELQPLEVAIGLSLPPYVVSDERSGMEYDIVEAALADAGYELVPVFVEFGDLPAALADGRAAAAMTVTGRTVPDAALSAVHIVYRNVALTLLARHLDIATIGDLRGHSISAFQKAADYLPPEFAAAVAANPGYHETAEQFRQPLELFSGEVDVVVADANIFEWYRYDPRVRAAADTAQQLARHDIFPPTPYRVAFADPAVRDAFDAALAALRESGRYEAIVAAWGGVQ